MMKLMKYRDTRNCNDSDSLVSERRHSEAAVHDLATHSTHDGQIPVYCKWQFLSFLHQRDETGSETNIHDTKDVEMTTVPDCGFDDHAL